MKTLFRKWLDRLADKLGYERKPEASEPLKTDIYWPAKPVEIHVFTTGKFEKRSPEGGVTFDIPRNTLENLKYTNPLGFIPKEEPVISYEKDGRQRRIKELLGKIEVALEREDFEEAAKLRDEIKALENGREQNS